MIDLTWSLIVHCQADATLIALVPAARILEVIEPGSTLPAMAIHELRRDYAAQSSSQVDIRFTIAVPPAERANLVAIRKRLFALFQEQFSHTISTAGNAIYCISSQAIGTEDGIHKPEADECWMLREDYRFIIPTES